MDEQPLGNTTTVSQKTQAGVARMQRLTGKQRSELARKAINKRWANRNTKTNKTPKSLALSNKVAKNKSSEFNDNKIFDDALSTAEKRLAKAIEERAKAANLWAVLSAEIPSLQRTIAALKNQQSGCEGSNGATALIKQI
jgi:hypothetical protein